MDSCCITLIYSTIGPPILCDILITLMVLNRSCGVEEVVGGIAVKDCLFYKNHYDPVNNANWHNMTFTIC